MADAISIQGVSKAYKSGKEFIQALDNVTLSVREGEIFGLLGPNGAGKTTLISILAGILSPDSGTARIFNRDVAKETRAVQATINVVSGFSGVIYSLSVEEALMYYCLLYGVKNPNEKIASVIRSLELTGSEKTEADDLSSGMKQRYLIAKGLLNDPPLLIMDEPTVGLDLESAINVRNIIKGLKKEGRTILLTTHNMFDAEELCDRIAFINHGRIITVGTAVELKGRIISNRVIEIHCSMEQCVVDTLSELDGVNASIKSRNLVNVSVDSYKRMKEVMKALAGCDSEIYGVNELEPTLEETYLKIINGGEGKKRGKPASGRDAGKTAGKPAKSPGRARGVADD